MIVHRPREDEFQFSNPINPVRESFDRDFHFLPETLLDRNPQDPENELGSVGSILIENANRCHDALREVVRPPILFGDGLLVSIKLSALNQSLLFNVAIKFGGPWTRLG